MHREPPTTFRGALKILGHQERPLIDKLDKLLGGVILAAGAGAGLAAVGVPAVAPLAVLAPIWGWVDQKNEAVGLLRRVLDGISDRIASTRGYERHELIAAAHTAIVVSAFFETLRERIGETAYKDLELSAQERAVLARRAVDPIVGKDVRRILYGQTVPTPNAVCGFAENTAQVQRYLVHLGQVTGDFLGGLRSWGPISAQFRIETDVPEAAVERYRSHYLKVAAAVPEFAIWANLGEHAATRVTIRGLRWDVLSALDGQGAALARLEALLNLTTRPGSSTSHLRTVLGRANRRVLNDRVVSADAESYGVAVVFPTIEESYINQYYHRTVTRPDSRLSDEAWWAERPIGTDLDLLLSTHITAPDATQLPLLLLGHPGAGKSLLTKVLAARLPRAAYTVVRVPLRRVSANAPVYQQIQQALDDATHQRVSWTELVEESAQTIRVVLLDGLDELLQATSADRTGYLQEVAEFQRIEYAQERPVIVVVTSRTVVADRVDVPPGTPVVKLDEFDDEQIATWLGTWNQANEMAIASGTVRRTELATALAHRELACQPLLLLMLALYSADPHAPGLAADMSLSDLYGRLLDNFARREVSKRADVPLRGTAMEDAVRTQLRRLSVAAIGMFNRGRQDITEAQLSDDLTALGEAVQHPSSAAARDEEGRRLLGEFFFVHAPEVRLRSAEDPTPPAEAPQRRASISRCYEFLHATFGEYLVATYVVDVLAEVADAAFGGRRPRDPDDQLLYALLGHQPLAIQRPVLTFAGQAIARLDTGERDRIAQTLQSLLGTYRHREESTKYANYRPLRADRIRQLAAYSANLVLLRIAAELDGTGVGVAVLLPDAMDGLGALRSPGSEDGVGRWRTTVNLWRSGLDATCWLAMLSAVRYDRRCHRAFLYGDDESPLVDDDLVYARLVGVTHLERKLRLGSAICDGHVYYDLESNWFDMMRSWLIPRLALPLPGITGSILAEPPEGTPDHEVHAVTELICNLLRARADELSFSDCVAFVEWLLKRPGGWVDGLALAMTIRAHPTLLAQLPPLGDPKLYRSVPAALVPILLAEQRLDGRLDPSLREQSAAQLVTLRETLEAGIQEMFAETGPPEPSRDQMMMLLVEMMLDRRLDGNGVGGNLAL